MHNTPTPWGYVDDVPKHHDHPTPRPDPGPDHLTIANRRMEPLPALLRRLRESRRLTQLELANAAGYTSQVIANAEQGRRIWKPGTGRHVLRALAHKDPVTEIEAHDFLVQSRATESIAGRLPVDVHLQLIHEGIVQDPSAHRTRPVELSPPAAVDLLIREAMNTLGPERFELVLRAMLSIATVPPATEPTAADPPDPLSLETVSPPRKRPDGHIEQVFTQTRARPLSPAEQPMPTKGKLPRHQRPGA